MAKKTQEVSDELEFREPPEKRGGGTSWVRVLEPLIYHPNRWAMVKVFDTPEQAQNAQSNLTCRYVNIPHTDEEWVFASRGCELFAIYHGRKPRATSTRTRRAQPKG